MLNPAILREYDIRGVVGATLFEDDARAIGAGFAAILRDKALVPEGVRPKVAVGYDGRLSSPMLEAALVEGWWPAVSMSCASACRPRRCCILRRLQPSRCRAAFR